jgi:hypothetical protein
MRGHLLTLVRVVAPALAIAYGGPAAAGSPSLAQARQAYEDLEYDKVTPLLQKALGEAEGPDEEVEIFELLATMHVTYNRDAKATEAFVELLRRRSDYAPPPNSSPKIRQVFAAARAEFEEEQAALAPEPTPDEPVVPAQVEPEEPPAQPPAPQPSGLSGTTGGAPREPEPRGDLAPPIYETWWFWTGVGTVAAAVLLGGGSYLVWTLSQPDVPETDFGPYQLK